MKLFSEYYLTQKVKLLGHVLRCCDTEPDKFTTLQSDTPYPRLNPVQRIGQPKLNWAHESMKTAWKWTKDTFEESDDDFDFTSRQHVQTLNIAAHVHCF